MLRDKYSVVLLVIAAGSLAFALISKSPYHLSVVIWIIISALLATSLRFVLLFGETNVATAAFFGLGAYCAGAASINLGLPFLLALLVAGIFAAAVSAVFGIIALRLTGPYFMLVSFAFAEVLRLIYSQADFLGGNSGIVGIYPPHWLDPWLPAVTVGIGFAIILAMSWFESSMLGRIFTGIRTNTSLMQAVGFNTFLCKVLGLVLASFAAGIAGGLQAFTAHVISPGDFGYVVAVFALAYVKLGGQRHALGAVLGAGLLTTASQWLQGSGAGEQIMFGAAIMITLLLFPEGLLGLVESLREWRTTLLLRCQILARQSLPSARED